MSEKNKITFSKNIPSDNLTVQQTALNNYILIDMPVYMLIQWKILRQNYLYKFVLS